MSFQAIALFASVLLAVSSEDDGKYRPGVTDAPLTTVPVLRTFPITTKIPTPVYPAWNARRGYPGYNDPFNNRWNPRYDPNSK